MEYRYGALPHAPPKGPPGDPVGLASSLFSFFYWGVLGNFWASVSMSANNLRANSYSPYRTFCDNASSTENDGLKTWPPIFRSKYGRSRSRHWGLFTSSHASLRRRYNGLFRSTLQILL